MGDGDIATQWLAVGGVSDPRPSDRDITLWMTSYGPGLRRFFARRVNDGDVDDLIQEVFLKMQAARIDNPIENVERYLFRVARNVLVSQHRMNRARESGQAAPYEDGLGVADDLSPERIAIGREEYACAMRAILDLPPRARAAFQFHRFENMTYRAIAERMGISKESVKELMHRAITSLTRAMDGEP
jgi:RNA polymerase sigma-70 factor (ECF subfamily)